MVGAGGELGRRCRIDGPAVIGDGSRVGEGARISDSIILPGAQLAGGAILVDTILGAASLLTPGGTFQIPRRRVKGPAYRFVTICARWVRFGAPSYRRRWRPPLRSPGC